MRSILAALCALLLVWKASMALAEGDHGSFFFDHWPKETVVINGKEATVPVLKVPKDDGGATFYIVVSEERRAAERCSQEAWAWYAGKEKKGVVSGQDQEPRIILWFEGWPFHPDEAAEWQYADEAPVPPQPSDWTIIVEETDHGPVEHWFWNPSPNASAFYRAQTLPCLLSSPR